MAPHRLVVVREAEGRGPKLDAKWGDVIEGWVGADSSDASVVLVVVTPKVDKRVKWVKAFREPAMRNRVKCFVTAVHSQAL